MSAAKSVRTVKTASSIGGGRLSVTTGGAAAAAGHSVMVADGPQRSGAVYPPSLQSNLQRDADQDVVFNSIGFYSDLLGRLDE